MVAPPWVGSPLVDADVLGRLAALPGVADAVERARDACTRLRWHQALRRRTDAARAESTARAARASAALDGAERRSTWCATCCAAPVPPRPTPSAPWCTARCGPPSRPRRCSRSSPAHPRRRSPGCTPRRPRAWCRTTRSAAPAPATRPRATWADRRLAAPGGAELSSRLDGLATLLRADGPALVIAALAHAEVLALRPFVAGNGVVARALQRAVVVERGLDPTGVAVPEVGLLAAGLPAYAAALGGYVRGTPEGGGLAGARRRRGHRRRRRGRAGRRRGAGGAAQRRVT
ncbi:oxidoreductase [Angustibacter aerolatus]|uniref:Oxidoreductase n=1 Tax=Angustibacter aerolatus TaxID=1162965 RepID=A0ABQ6JIC8_9ACTN|nr:oxidoreductase [Angustibacter aerolatus]